jgi:hypothetical protein
MLYRNNSIKLNVQLSIDLDPITNIQYVQITYLNENLQKSFVNCPKTAKLLFFYFYNFMRKKLNKNCLS